MYNEEQGKIGIKDNFLSILWMGKKKLKRLMMNYFQQLLEKSSELIKYKSEYTSLNSGRKNDESKMLKPVSD